MDVIEKFAQLVTDVTKKSPKTGRGLLTTGYRAFRLKNKYFPDKNLNLSQRYVADEVMKVIISALRNPEKTAMCSLFVPGELLSASGVVPYSVEALSSYLAGTLMERGMLDVTASNGIPETMCSFHRVFLGAIQSDLMPKPPFIIYTNVACDANMLTFPYLKQKYDIPDFFIDVPYEQSEESVIYVASQLRDMKEFLEDMTKKAMKVCYEAHKGQYDKGGVPYVFHPFHLAEQMETEDTVIAALLHDVVEDTVYTFADLKQMGFSDTVLNALRLLTHDDDVPYMEYVREIRNNPIAKAVKLADLAHNSDLSRLDMIDEKALERVKKYKQAIALLKEEG